MTDGLYLSHGDDPYIGADIYGIPASGLLLSQATYDAWFVNEAPNLISESIGRGNPASEIAYLSGKLELLYCGDPMGTPHASSKLFKEFGLYPDLYPLSYLENLPPDSGNPALPASLWDRLAQKIASQGGCGPMTTALMQQMNAYAAVLPVSERLDYNW
jgi:hypothetical protein